jgi:hypothetical protein
MNRQDIINKIQAMLKLQESTSFENEAATAAALIDKLCKQYEININDVGKVQILNEEFRSYKRANNAYNLLLNAVAYFYDGKAYITNGDVKSIRIIGSEAQQIQIKLYFEFLYQVMERECDKAYAGEKVISELTGSPLSRSFKTNFRKAFVDKVGTRLNEMKIEENRVHQDANAVKEQVALMKLGRAKPVSGPSGAGAFAGGNVGSTVSLNRQASGSSQKALCGV